ncbi:cysteine hydrolase family protein [Aquipuribacter nitratireducens]|uniref:Cysteine hydrolase family protein n=1 Tax=Aquipuribacter nitratireducens TaxID=650104 RepID=A0ABW0GJY4_9MICO
MSDTTTVPAARLETTDVRLDADTALVVVDVQDGFDDPAWGTRDNAGAEAAVAALVAAWRGSGRPVVLVRHDSAHAASPLHPTSPGNAYKGEVTEALGGASPDLLVTKTVNSSFHGTPDLAAWLRERGTRQLVVCGVQTNFCCETTARVGANLGFDVLYALDATWTYDLPGFSGGTVPASLLREVTATNLANEFCRVVRTATLLEAAGRG